MQRITVLSLIMLLALAGAQVATAQEGETWITQEKVYNVTLIKIHPNMGEQYLNNLKRTWVTGLKEAMKEGVITDYKILTSMTPADQGYNLLLLTEFPNLDALDVDDEARARQRRIEERVEAIISEQETDEITATVYPNIREIVSEKLLREIKFVD